MLEHPQNGIPCPTTLSVLVRHAGNTDRLLVYAVKGRGGVEQIEGVTELHIFRTVFLADVERGANAPRMVKYLL